MNVVDHGSIADNPKQAHVIAAPHAQVADGIAAAVEAASEGVPVVTNRHKCATLPYVGSAGGGTGVDGAGLGIVAAIVQHGELQLVGIGDGGAVLGAEHGKHAPNIGVQAAVATHQYPIEVSIEAIRLTGLSGVAGEIPVRKTAGLLQFAHRLAEGPGLVSAANARIRIGRAVVVAIVYRARVIADQSSGRPPTIGCHASCIGKGNRTAVVANQPAGSALGISGGGVRQRVGIGDFRPVAARLVAADESTHVVAADHVASGIAVGHSRQGVSADVLTDQTAHIAAIGCDRDIGVAIGNGAAVVGAHQSAHVATKTRYRAAEGTVVDPANVRQCPHESA